MNICHILNLYCYLALLIITVNHLFSRFCSWIGLLNCLPPPLVAYTVFSGTMKVDHRKEVFGSDPDSDLGILHPKCLVPSAIGPTLKSPRATYYNLYCLGSHLQYIDQSFKRQLLCLVLGFS